VNSSRVVDVAVAQARMALAKDIYYRQWNTKLGGVYAYVDDFVKPNPYLSHIPDRDILTTSGRRLTIINPAYMMRQLFEISKNDSEVKTHLVSNKLLNPINAPDEWETSALEYLYENNTDYFAVVKEKDKSYLRYMTRFITEEKCLKCHAHQGYKVGDIRGGISTKINVSSLLEGEKRIKINTIFWHFILWALVLGASFWGYKIINNLVTRLIANEKKMSSLFAENTSILESAYELIFGIDKEGNIQFSNPSAERITGYNQAELKKKTFIDIFGQREAYMVFDDLNQKGSSNGENKIKRADGSVLDVEYFVSLINLDSSETYAVVSLFDISDRIEKREILQNSLYEKEILLREINHRVKNNLQLIINLLELQGEYSRFSPELSPRDLLRDTRTRIMAMALMHEILYKKDDEKTTCLGTYIKDLAVYLKSAYSSDELEIDYDVEDCSVALPVCSTITCGILVNEIVTNCIKHAFEGVENPKMLISVKHIDEKVVISVKDNGIGFDYDDVAQKSDSMGLGLIESLTEQLEGELDVLINGGAEFRITIPIA
jgi:PAS domain S-box-containing protein